jgi:hypothetical protein
LQHYNNQNQNKLINEDKSNNLLHKLIANKANNLRINLKLNKYKNRNRRDSVGKPSPVML